MMTRAEKRRQNKEAKLQHDLETGKSKTLMEYQLGNMFLKKVAHMSKEILLGTK